MDYIQKPYQEQATQKIIDNKRIAIFLQMGFGKTGVTLKAISHFKTEENFKSVLIIAPLRVASLVWTDERDKFTDFHNLTISKILGNEKQRIKALNLPADIYIINAENTEWLLDQYLGDYIEDKFSVLVLDESSLFKSAKAKRTKYLARTSWVFDRVILLTGTPNPNSYIDLWSQFRILDNGDRLEQRINHFHKMYCHLKDNYFNYQLNDDAKPKIEEKIKDITFYINNDDVVFDKNVFNTDIMYNDILVELPASKKTIYNKYIEELASQYDNNFAVLDALQNEQLTIKLMQLANGCIYDLEKKTHILHSSKIDALKEIIETNSDKNILVVYSFKSDVEVIKQHISIATGLKGKNERETSKLIDNWNKGDIPVGVIHPKSLGHGVNLQYGGNIIVWYGLTYSLEYYQQTNARLSRIGQKEMVVINHIIAKGTIDEEIMQILKSKSEQMIRLKKALEYKL